MLQHMADVENTVELMMARLDELSGMLEAVRCHPPSTRSPTRARRLCCF